MTAAVAILWAALCAPILIFPLLDVDPKIPFNYSLLAQIIAPLTAGFICYYAGRAIPRTDATRRALLLLGTGVASWGLGAALYALYPLWHGGQETPYPWYSDIGYLLLYPPVFGALFLYKQSIYAQVPPFGRIGSSILFLLAMAIAVRLNLPKLSEADSLLTHLVTWLYVICDPLLLGATASIASLLFGGLAARPWWLILCGLFLFYLADLFFTYLVLQGQYASGNPLDIGWPLSNGFIAVAALMIRDIYREMEI